MEPIQFSYVLLAYFLAATSIFFAAAFFNKRLRLVSAIYFVLVLVGLAVTVALGALLESGENYIYVLYSELLELSRVPTIAIAVGLALAAPLSLYLLVFAEPENNKATRNSLLTLAGFGLTGVIVLGGLVVGKDIISPYLAHPDSVTQGDTGLESGKLVADGFVIEDLLDLTFVPIRVAVSESGQVFLSGHTGIAAQSGVVVELTADEGQGLKEKVVALNLNRPYGLLATDQGLLVSRSGQYTRWLFGEMEQTSTGAVTLLKDLDGDGVMDYYHDVVTGLPGARAPDYLHQNNDLALDKQGNLYITSAFNSDAQPAVHPWEGKLLKASGENFSEIEIFASGFRNSFGVEFGPDGQLFATDNDAQSGVVANAGDKFLHITKGANFGHPYGVGTSPTALRSSFALGGLAYADSENLPDPYRDSLYVVSYGEGKIMRVELEKQNDVYRAKFKHFATVPGAVDIDTAPNGDFYVVVYPDKVVRIRPVDNK